MIDSIIRGNRGGGVFVTYGGVGAAEVVDTEITGNVAQFGGGISAESREEPAVFRRCTVVGNAAQFGGGLYVWDGSAVLLENTILRFNCAEVDGNDAYMPDTDDLASLTLSCCAVDPDQVVLGSDGHDLQYAGPQVLEDPLLCAPADCEDAPSNTGRYQLQAGSPCVEENSPCGGRIGAYDDDCDPATVALVPGGVELSVAPNPVSGGCTFVLSSDDAARAGVDLSGMATATIELFASDGRLVRTLIGHGGEWRWDGNDAFGVAATAGVYYAKVGAATSRLVVVR